MCTRRLQGYIFASQALTRACKFHFIMSMAKSKETWDFILPYSLFPSCKFSCSFDPSASSRQVCSSNISKSAYNRQQYHGNQRTADYFLPFLLLSYPQLLCPCLCQLQSAAALLLLLSTAVCCCSALAGVNCSPLLLCPCWYQVSTAVRCCSVLPILILLL